ncbi:MAG: type III secretion system outer membrane ring subunit SctC [Chromatiales bacterium]|nr:type III secretion system outer membrane ring subunit SctC [Chromatiales bacterium]
MKVFIFALLLINISIAQAQPSQSAQPAWIHSDYGYYSQNKPLAEVIADFAAELKLPVVISPEIVGAVSGSFPTMKAVDFLSLLARVYRLMWFYDGAVLHIYSTKEIKETIIPLSAKRATELEQAFKEMNVIGTHYQWKLIPNRNRIELSGPPKFLELAQEVIGSVEPSSNIAKLPPLGDDHVVKIFNLKYIYALADGEQQTIDIAQLLGRIMNVGYYVTEGSGPTGQIINPSGKLLGSGVSPSYGADANATAQSMPVATEENSMPDKDTGDAYVIVDTRLNMVIVRDKAERMPLYEAIIEQLDKPLDQIEIEVLILDINDDATKNLGVEWNYESGDFVYQGLSVAEMTAQQSLDFRIRLEALETEGRARISARPSVLTLDNHEAEFSNQETFYVRLGAGDESQAVDLVPVTYGATLKVKPHIIYKSDDQREILLTLDIADGRRSDNTREVDGVPSVTNSTIKTQAMVGNGKSLLIGGYKVEQESVGVERIPFLGYLPVVGLFFRTERTTDLDNRRYFLISPRLVRSEVVFESNVDDEEIIRRDNQNHQNRYPSLKNLEASRANLQPLQSFNTIERSHAGPP